MTNRVKVKLGDLIDAASHTGPKRAPAGARGQIPKTTLIRCEGNGLMVETPYLGTLVETLSGKWDTEVEVPAPAFLELLMTASKAWQDVGGKNAVVQISTVRHSLKVEWKNQTSKRMLTMNTLRKMK